MINAFVIFLFVLFCCCCCCSWLLLFDRIIFCYWDKIKIFLRFYFIIFYFYFFFVCYPYSFTNLTLPYLTLLSIPSVFNTMNNMKKHSILHYIYCYCLVYIKRIYCFSWRNRLSIGLMNYYITLQTDYIKQLYFSIWILTFRECCSWAVLCNKNKARQTSTLSVSDLTIDIQLLLVFLISK